MSLEEVSGFEIGQSEPLTVRLRDLVRSYPKGISIFKEFIQNADDGGASRVGIVLDLRQHPSEKLPAKEMKALMGPALLIFNSAPFSEDDWKAIQTIGQSGKVRETLKTGRFGHGFNVAYNVTDYPSFLTGDRVAFFDPHQNVVPQGKNGSSRGRGWKLTELWTSHPALLRCYMPGGLKDGDTFLNGTIFRLPLRTLAQASKSEICQDPFTNRDFYLLLNQFKKSAAELLLFLKNVLSVTVSEIDASGAQRILVRLETTNVDEVKGNRSSVNEALGGGLENLQRLVDSNRELPRVTYQHDFEITAGKRTLHESWRIASGLYADTDGAILKTAQEMLSYREKAIPWAGVACKITRSATGRIAAQSIRGHVFCGLPLPQTTSLPVHIHGFFDLDSSRQAITSDATLVGRDAVRRRWNELLCTGAVSCAYAQLLADVAIEVASSDPKSFYDLWPNVSEHAEQLFVILSKAVYQQIENKVVIRSKSQAGPVWYQIGEVGILPLKWKILQAPLLADGMALPQPALPKHVVDGFQRAGVKISTIIPKIVRDRLRTKNDIGVIPADAPRLCLQKTEWIKALLRFCIEDGQQDLAGLPLALLADGKLHTFGYSSGGTIFVPNDQQRIIFRSRPHWFISEELQRDFKFQDSLSARLWQMTPRHVVSNLKTFLPDDSGSGVAWKPEGREDPNADWLQAVYEYFSEDANFRGTDSAALKKYPLVPDQFQKLHAFAMTDTPLLIDSSSASNDALTGALQQFKVPVVSGPSSLMKAIGRFVSLHPAEFIWPLTGPDLVDSLNANEDEWINELNRYRPDVHDILWDFLSDERWEGKYSDEQLDRLRSLNVYVTQSKTLTRGTHPDIFLPANFSPPSIIGADCLLRVGKHNKWRELLVAVGIAQLDRSTLISRLLLPKYQALNSQQQYEILEWIRDNLSAAQTQMEKADPTAASALKSAVASHRLIRCTDAELHEATRIYHPDHSAVIKEILGERAVFPDTGIYRNQSQWFDFFSALGMSATVRPVDILRYLDDMIDESDDLTEDQLRASARIILEHLVARWDRDLGETRVEDTKTRQNVLFKDALGLRAWIPAQRQETRLVRYVAFVIPQKRLYRPNDIYLPKRGHLVATEFPVADIGREPSRALQEALQFKSTVETGVVLKQFDAILSAWQRKKAEIQIDALERTLGEIYRYLGQLQLSPDESQDQLGPTLSESELEQIQTRYAEQACLWNPKSKHFWLPHWVFDDPMPLFEPRRTCIRAKGDEDRGYKVLGRRGTPTAMDYIEFLNQLKTEFEDAPLPAHERAGALHALRGLADGLAETLEDDVLVLTDREHLVPCGWVYMDDAPWYEGRLNTSSIDLLHQDVPQALVRKLDIRRLSESVAEKISSIPVESTMSSFVELVTRIEATVTSEEFQVGLRRLVRNKQGFVYPGETDWLTSVQVRGVQVISAELWLDTDTFVGEYETECFWDVATSEFYVAESGIYLASHVLAREINRNLSENARLTDLSPLVAIIDCSPSQIQYRLDRLRIPLLDEDAPIEDESQDILPEEFAFPESETDSQVTPVEQEDGSQSSKNATFARGHEGLETKARSAGAADAATAGTEETVAPLTEPPAGDSGLEDRPRSRDKSDFEAADQGELSNTSGRRSPGTPSSRRQSHQGTQQQRRQQRLLSYVVPDRGDERKDEPDPDDDDRAENMSIAQAGVQRVLEYESSCGRVAVSLSHTNPGFDVKSVDERTGETRFIEVKGTAGAWSVAGVPVSPTQFRFGWTHPGEFWLYVVEFARDDSRARVYPIHDVVSRVTQFRFDSGWKQASNNEKLREIPKKGMRVRLSDGRHGEIIEVDQRGKICRITIRFDDQSIGSEMFNPAAMFLLDA